MQSDTQIFSTLTLNIFPHFRPKTLVPDTNILVDNLADLRGLAETGDWQLRVPTTVMVELEGLARSGAAPAHNGRKYLY